MNHTCLNSPFPKLSEYTGFGGILAIYKLGNGNVSARFAYDVRDKACCPGLHKGRGHISFLCLRRGLNHKVGKGYMIVRSGMLVWT